MAVQIVNIESAYISSTERPDSLILTWEAKRPESHFFGISLAIFSD